MSNRSVITLFQQMSERLESIVAMLDSIRLSVDQYRTTEIVFENIQEATIYEIEQVTQEFARMNVELNDSLRKLRQRIDQLNLLYDITNQLSDQVSLNQVIELTMDAMWQKAPLNFVVVILGDTELGPYHYQNMRGISDAWRFLGARVPFPTLGIARSGVDPSSRPR